MRNLAASATHRWIEQFFGAQAAAKGGIIRRAAHHVEREVGRDVLEAAVRARGFHLVECGGQLIVICNAGLLRVIC